MRKNIIITFVLFLFSLTLLSDFIRLENMEDSFLDIKEIVEIELEEGEIYESKQFGKISYVCRQNCTYEDREIVRYDLIAKESFIFTLGVQEITKTCYFYLDKSNQ